jgi:DNA-binding CsgD family transcriptional regulator
MFAGGLGTGSDEHAIADAARSASARGTDRAADLLLQGLVTRFTEGYPASVAPLTRALHAFADLPPGDLDLRWLWPSCRIAVDLWDDDLWHQLATRGVQLARETGALGLLPNALNHLAALNVHSGAFTAAAVLVDEVEAITQATGVPPLKYSAIKLAVARGDEVATQSLVDHPIADARARGEGSALSLAWSLTSLLYNSQGQYGKALADARLACEHEDVMAYGWALVELVEAGVRVGHREEAELALDRLSVRTRASATEWALGVEARSRGLLTDDETCYEESIERLGRSRATFDLARSRLVYGEWLRRENRRVDAREQLRVAHEMFTGFGADGFAERARRELHATGETVRKRSPETRDALTPQEIQVARLARDGHTNPEIGAQLFISPRTVEYHLHKVFRKLDVSSRRELRDALAKAPEQAAVGDV